jgi:hypothetical protein
VRIVLWLKTPRSGLQMMCLSVPRDTLKVACASLIGFPPAKVEAVSIYSLILSVVLLVSLITSLCLVCNSLFKVLTDERQKTNNKQQKSVDKDLQFDELCGAKDDGSLL